MNFISKTKDSKQSNLAFAALISLFVVFALLFKDKPNIIMWFGFGLAGYSAIANDSIQTIGTFLSSNKKTPWWVLWLFIGGILVSVLTYGWFVHSGDIAFGRLDRIPQPDQIGLVHILAPVALIVLTRLKMPVSTTFLILSVFSSSKTIGGMLQKTFIGYFAAFLTALLIWAIIAQLKKRKIFFTDNYNKKAWRIFQWFTTAYLWSTWLMQDIANTTVFLSREISLNAFLAITTTLFLFMGFILYHRGGRIQEVINEKSDVVDTKAATIIDLVFGTILIIFKEWNNLPMSTTWVFLGLLAGREIALTHLSDNDKPYLKTLGLVMKDIALASIGLLISLGIAVLAKNDVSLSSLNDLMTNLF